MAFSSALFIIAFLPIFTTLHFFVPQKRKNAVLFVASLAFYFWCGIDFLVLVALSSCASWAFALLIEKSKQEKIRLLFLVLGICVFVGLLFYFKYLRDFSKFFFNKDFSPTALPLGISFYSFSLVSYLLDVYWQKCPAQKNVANVVSYVLFFPKVVQGPIMRWDDFSAQLENRELSGGLVAKGLRRFAIGFFKKVVIADQLTSLVAYSFDNVSGAGTGSAWLSLLAQLMQLYYDFSGYSDMAIGLGLMFGFALPENFDHPYLSFSVAEYWRRWHISLGAWFRDYIYMPLYRVLSKNSTLRKANGGLWMDLSALLVTWILTGVWHGSGEKFFYYGLWWFAFVALERVVEYFQKKRRKALGIKKANMGVIEKTVRYIETMFAILIGQVMFRAADMRTVFLYVKKLFAWSDVDGLLVFRELNNEIAFALLLALVFCFPVHKFARDRFFEKYKIGKIAYNVLLALMFVCAFMQALSVGGSPFLYQVF